MAAQQIGIVTTVVGHVVAVNADGVERVLAVGDVVYADEVIRTADAAAVTIEFNDGGWFDLGGNAQAVLDSDVYSQEGPDAEAAGAVAKVEDIQAAIEAGGDPTQLLPPTAAGAAGGAAGGEGGHSFVVLDHDFNAVTPEAGIPTAAEPLLFENAIDIILPVEEGLPLISINDVTVQEPLVHRGGQGGQSQSGDGTFPALTVPGPGQGGNSLINGLGGAAGFGDAAMSRNDDGSSAFIDVTSIFGPGGMNFFGTNYTGFWINNNGNITFDGPLGTYTPFAITGDTGNPMIAPFFADVDTRGATGNVSEGGTSTGSNLVYYHLDTANGVITITWDDVGYYSSETDLVNAFQLRIFSTGDGNFGFEFRYENVEWTTGAASGGVGGFGGSVAHAGWTAGDGVNYYELPQSGNQAAILDLENTSNPDTAIDGNWVFNVVGGEVVEVDNDPATTTAVFTVTLSEPSDTDVVISFTTADGSAISGGSGVGENDYGATSGTVTILAGQTSATIEVTVYGDVAPENIEQFFVNLTGIVSGNAAFADDQGVGTILDNTPPDALPVAVDDALVVNEDSGTTNANLATNDTRGDGTNVWALDTPASNGVVVVNANGTYSYTPNADYNGPDSFTYTITDADGDTDTATVNITVNPVNDPPSIVVDPDPENAGGPGGANDIVYEAGLPNGSAPAPTTVTVGGTFTVSDPDGLADIDSVTINGTTIAIGVLGTSDPLNTISGTNGTLTVTGYDSTTGVATYSYTLTSPTADGSGTETDTFTLTTSDGTVSSAPASIVIDIVDDVPTATVDGPYSLTEDGATTVVSGNVLDNDTSGADAPKAFDAWSGSDTTAIAGLNTYGTLTQNADGTWSYVLNNALAATQALTSASNLSYTLNYTMKDADGDTSPATLTITIAGANDGVTITGLTPKANGGDVVVDEDDLADGSDTVKESLTQAGDFTISAPDGLDDLTVGGTAVISNGVFTATSFTTPLGNTLAFTAYDPATGKVSYTYTLADNEAHASGAGQNALYEDFAVLLTDSDGSSASDTLSVQIVDDVPTATVDGPYSLTEDGATTVVSGNVLDNDTSGADAPKA
ncbi:MAG: retention module-containing protein, partial [Immundisolibacter sp.]|uniref:retention module-containing protein n=1 Tax=Immundisolibacter sp. TaxID=1934948 RepID=UPI0019B8C51D